MIEKISSAFGRGDGQKEGRVGPKKTTPTTYVRGSVVWTLRVGRRVKSSVQEWTSVSGKKRLFSEMNGLKGVVPTVSHYIPPDFL